MKAIVIEQTGGPEQLIYGDAEAPTPGEGEVVVAVAAAGLNFIDTYHRSGLYPVEFPFTPGVEGAGTITSVGAGVDGLDVGDRVGWVDAAGSYADQNVIPAERAIPVPDSIDSKIAAAVLLQGLTAHYLAIDTYPLGQGDRCLIHAGAGGVGLLLTQIAKMRGATVVTTVGSDDKAAASREAGADEVINYETTDFGDAVESLFGPKALDVVYDGVGAATFERGLDLLRPRGVMVTFGNASGAVPPIAPLLLAQKGSIYLTRPTMGHYLQTREELLMRASDLFSWIDSGTLAVSIGDEYPLAEAQRAHEALESRQTSGKVLLVP